MNGYGDYDPSAMGYNMMEYEVGYTHTCAQTNMFAELDVLQHPFTLIYMSLRKEKI
jgi:hypothetical protein